MSEKLRLKVSGTSQNQKKVFRDNNSINTWELLEFSYKVAHNEKILISIFQKLSATIKKTFILTWGLGFKLSYCEV